MAKTDINEISINGVEYVRKDSGAVATSPDGLPYVIVRCDRSGVFAGFLQSRSQQEATILQARRLWYWTGAASLSQLAVDGTKTPKSCKFPTPVSKIEVTDAIEILEVTAKAKASIKEVAVWQQ